MAETISGTDPNGVTLSAVSQNPLTITATGYISNLGEAALYGAPAEFAWTVTNYGRIRGFPGTPNGMGVAIQLESGGAVTNERGGTIHGYGFGVWMPSGGGSVTNDGLITDFTNNSNFLPGHTYIDVNINGAAGTVTNSGDILAYGTKSIGVYLNADGSVTNNARAEIVGVALAISGTFIGVDIKGAAGTVSNSGYIGLFASGTITASQASTWGRAAP